MLYRTGVIAAVKQFGDQYYANDNPRQRTLILKNLAAAICTLYAVTAPEVTLEASGSHGRNGACTSDGIKMYGKTSMTTFLHELYHWLTYGRGVCQDEGLARQWSVTLFIRAMPARAGKNLIGFGNVTFPDRRANAPQRRLARIIPVRADQPAAVAAAE